MATVLLVLPSFSADISLALNINYSQGTSEFFKESSLFLSSSGNTYLETIHNKMGIGFNFSAYIQVIKKLYVSPGFSLSFGHQHYEYQNTASNESKGQNSFFNIYSGELNLAYDLLTLKNGWVIDVFGGLGYNWFKADDLTREDDRNYLGAQAGVMLKFMELKHLGFQVLAYYKMPFGSEYFAYGVIQAGVRYRL